MIAGTDKSKAAQGPQPKPLGTLAEFRNADDLLSAARTLKSNGYTRMEAFTPFPVHGIDDVLDIKPSPLPWFVLSSGLLGGVAALAFQWWTNTIDYAYIVSGKPMFSLPANIPVTFEVIILMAAFAAFFGMLFFNGLPKFSNPLFKDKRFLQATNDRFFLFVEADDERFPASVSDLREKTSAAHVHHLNTSEDPSTTRLPRWIVLTGVVVASFAVLPPIFIMKARTTQSELPRFHNFFNMDFQPKFKSQTESPLFADGRAMRPRIAGTIPRNSLIEDERFLYGTEPPANGAPSPDGVPDATETLEVSVVDQEPSGPNYVQSIPIEVDRKLVQDGRTQFNIHCAVCHGRAGYGNGLASQRALELEQGTWVPPTSIHAPHLLEQPAGKLFNSITNGVRKMPAYGHQITPRDRWAIIAYIRALQRSQNTTIEDVPEDLRPALREFN